MIEVLLLIGFWLIYIFINTAVSVMSKDSLFFVLAHGTLFIIFVGLRWLLQVYLNEQYAMRRYLNHSDISLVTDLMSWDVLGTMVVLIIVCIVLFGFVVTTNGPLELSGSDVSSSGGITYAWTVIATVGILMFAGPTSVVSMDLKTEDTRIVSEQTFQPGQDGITFEMQSDKDAPWESVTQPHTVEELRRADFRAVQGSNTSELESWKTTLRPKDIAVSDDKAFAQWVVTNKIPVRVVGITRQRVVERQVHPKYPRIHKDQEYNVTVVTYELVDGDAPTQYKNSKSLDNLVNPK